MADEGGERRGPVRLERAWWVLLAYWALMYLGTHWPEIERYKPETGWWIPYFGEVVHGGMYAGWAALWMWVLNRQGRVLSGRGVWLLIGGAALYALFDEATQPLVGRSGKIDDWATDMAGVVVTVGVLWAARRRMGLRGDDAGEERKRS